MTRCGTCVPPGPSRKAAGWPWTVWASAGNWDRTQERSSAVGAAVSVVNMAIYFYHGQGTVGLLVTVKGWAVLAVREAKGTDEIRNCRNLLHVSLWGNDDHVSGRCGRCGFGTCYEAQSTGKAGRPGRPQASCELHGQGRSDGGRGERPGRLFFRLDSGSKQSRGVHPCLHL